MSMIRWNPFDELASLRESMDNYHRRELRYGAFVRSLTLPSGVPG